jgi:hypothetical protein
MAKRLRASRAIAAMFIALLTPAAQADPLRIDLRWEGMFTAEGFVVIDDDVLPAEAVTQVLLPDPSILDFQVSVTGSPIGNGTFGMDDFQSIWFYSPTTLDLTRELIGQPLGGGLHFGPYLSHDDAYKGGDFSVTNANPEAPTGTFFFVMSAAGGRDVDGYVQSATLVSMMPVIPEPPSSVLLALGGVALVVARRARPLRRSVAAPIARD